MMGQISGRVHGLSVFTTCPFPEMMFLESGGMSRILNGALWPMSIAGLIFKVYDFKWRAFVVVGFVQVVCSVIWVKVLRRQIDEIDQLEEFR